MLAEFGHFSLALAFMAAMVAAAGLFVRDDDKGVALVRAGASAQCAALLLTFLFLILAFIQTDYTVQLVASNSHHDKPLLYKIAGAWGNHEGSMLLWALLLSVYGVVFAHYSKINKAQLKIAIAVLGLISVGTLLFIIAASNPFLRLDPAPIVGRGLNPLLQDPALAIHPPILYTGYVGFAVPYAMGIAALMRPQLETTAHKKWAQEMLFWTMIPLAFMTLGVGLGSWWAYRELGWGGWWFWDPVENASLLPWLIGTALAHCAMIAQRTGALIRPILVLALLAFSMSILGTFLVRSGVLTSVHAFAVDPKRGILIFAFLCCVLGGGFGLYILKNPVKARLIDWQTGSRPSLMVAGILMLSVVTVTVFVGTIYPLIMDAIGAPSVTVGGPYYNVTATPLGWLLVTLMVAAPFANWHQSLWHKLPFNEATDIAVKSKQEQSINQHAEYKTKEDQVKANLDGLVTSLKLVLVPIIALLFALLFYKAGLGQSILFAIAVGFVTLVVIYGARHTPRTITGAAMLVAHGGIAIAFMGMAGAAFFSSESITSVQEGTRFVSSGHHIRFDGVKRGEGSNYTYERAKVIIENANGGVKTRMAPERRWYSAGDMVTSEAVIKRNLISDLYITLGDLRVPGADKADWALRVYHRPFISWIWLGCVMSFLGALLSVIALFKRKVVARSHNYEEIGVKEMANQVIGKPIISDTAMDAHVEGTKAITS